MNSANHPFTVGIQSFMHFVSEVEGLYKEAQTLAEVQQEVTNRMGVLTERFQALVGENGELPSPAPMVAKAAKTVQLARAPRKGLKASRTKKAKAAPKPKKAFQKASDEDAQAGREAVLKLLQRHAGNWVSSDECAKVLRNFSRASTESNSALTSRCMRILMAERPDVQSARLLARSSSKAQREKLGLGMNASGFRWVPPSGKNKHEKTDDADAKPAKGENGTNGGVEKMPPEVKALVTVLTDAKGNFVETGILAGVLRGHTDAKNTKDSHLVSNVAARAKDFGFEVQSLRAANLSDEERERAGVSAGYRILNHEGLPW